jgi:Flp pilus assembly protein TadD
MTSTTKPAISLPILLACVAAFLSNLGFAPHMPPKAPGGERSGRSGAGSPSPNPGLTFNRDIAPIIFQNCAVCHHPGGSAPFSLLSYEDVRKHGRQIVSVTKSRYMPPWLPAPGYGEFSGERRLSERQIATIGRWVNEGASEGAPSVSLSVPRFNEGWQLGKPDLVVKLPRPYTLRAEGRDVFRNFVFQIPVTAPRYVKGVEILPGNKKAIHHANVLIDRTGSSRRLDGRDGQPGFGGMELEIESESFEPQTHFLFWKPGSVAAFEPEGLAWLLEKGTDLVLNMHMQPAGKPELIQPSIGLYFTDTPPTRHPMLLQLEHDKALDIPAGEKHFVVEDQFRLPVEVQVLAVYPHAHYLGDDIQGFATLPGGQRKWLIRIKHWDLNWQAVYRYKAPILLPQGTTIAMRYTYDNSAENVRNPNHPPRRVVAGNQSSDEMAHLWLQVLPRHESDLKVLQASLMQQRIRKDPRDFVAHFNLGAVLQSEGKTGEAIGELGQALAIRPEDATALNNLGAALESEGKLQDAVSYFDRAVRVRPEYANAQYNLANSLLALGRAQEATTHFHEALEVQPEDADAHNNLGRALAVQGDLAGATAEFENALRINPEHVNAHYNLGTALAGQRKLAEAEAEFNQALRLDPQNADIHNDLGTVFALQGKLREAAAQFESALRINPGLTTARSNLERVRSRQGANN